MKNNSNDVYIVDGGRTPFLKAKGSPGKFKALDLAIQVVRPMLIRNGIGADDVDELIVGCVNPDADECNIAKLLALRLGLNVNIPAYTVQRNCASGLQSIDSAYRNISCGESDLVIAGGTETMSRAPLLFNDEMTMWLSELTLARTTLKKLAVIAKFRPKLLVPVISLLRALKDPTINLSMGQTAENLAYRFNISREEMDTYSMESHVKATLAQHTGVLDDEVITIYDTDGNHYSNDESVRPKNTVEKLGKLRPVFDKIFGNVTAGNSSPITDGAAFVLLASEDALDKYGLRDKVIAKIIDTKWAGVDPSEMGLGPVKSMVPLVMRNGLTCDDIDNWELNEAFAAQVIGCTKALNDKDYCLSDLGLYAPFGKIPDDKLNIHGGSISIGHPVGASGTRIVYHLAKTLESNGGRYGVASLCIGHGQGGAILIENLKR
jgi:acetyl-CoA C-acetyltransferase